MRAVWRWCVLSICLVAPSTSFGTGSPLGSVLILEQSPGPFYTALTSAVKTTLMKEARAPSDIYTENLDLAHFSGPRLESIMQDYFQEKYRGRPVGVILVSGALTLDLILRLRSTLWPDVPVVFAGVPDAGIAGRTLPPGVTGITMQHSFRDMLKTARVLVPELKRVALVGSPLRRTTLFRHFEEEIPLVAGDLEVMNFTGLPMGEMLGRLAVLPDDSAIVYTGLFTDGAGASFVPADALARIAEIANRPIAVNEDWYIGRGAVGGYIIDVEQIGREAAHLLARILEEPRAAETPVIAGDSLKPVFDWRQLQRWGIAEAQLPAGSEIRFRDPNVWDRYRWQIALVAVVFLLQALLIIDLFMERHRRRKAEALARRRMSELAHLNRVATAGELSASIVHEVAQPVGAMIVNANAGLRWLSKTVPDLGEVREALGAVVTDGHRASDVLGSIRAMFKKGVQDETVIDVNELVSEVLALVSGELRSQFVTLDVKLGQQLPSLYGNHVQLQQVILNLIMNALEAMSSVHDRIRKLQLTTGMDGPDDVLITVQDSGPGIDAENIARIFEHFFTTKSKGMGMGLSICKSIVESHNGRLWAEAHRAGGAVFHVALPGVQVGVP